MKGYYKEQFRRYESEILPQQTPTFEDLRGLIVNYGRVALTCFEADHLFCHRHVVAEHLEKGFDSSLRIKHP